MKLSSFCSHDLKMGIFYRGHAQLINDILHMSFLAGTHVFKAYPVYTTTEI